ncbi:MAG: PilZ domain-containing protein [Hyphomicrobiaceae bacterium]
MSESLGSERRGSPRYAVSIPGYVVFGNVQLPCQVQDLSIGGARVAIHDWRHPLPELLQLVELKEQNVFEAQVRWQRGGEAGLLFVDVCGPSKRREIIGQLVKEAERRKKTMQVSA